MRAESIADVVGLAARHTVGSPNCLQRSLVTWWLLGRRGISTDLRIGVRRVPGKAVPDFHAWVEQDDRVIGDREDIRELFVAFDSPVIPARARWDEGPLT